MHYLVGFKNVGFETLTKTQRIWSTGWYCYFT